jgi:hypothetical protein
MRYRSQFPKSKLAVEFEPRATSPAAARRGRSRRRGPGRVAEVAGASKGGS